MSHEKPDPESILARAIEIKSAAERAAFLDAACGADSQQREELERLVEDYFAAGSVLGEPAHGQLERTADLSRRISGPGVLEQPGQQIGPYKLLQKLGEGGIRVVYKTEGTSLDCPVALKFLAAHLVSNKDVCERFERKPKPPLR